MTAAQAHQMVAERRAQAQARAEALQAKVADFLALHGYKGPAVTGTFEHVRNCEKCGRRFETASVSFPGGLGLWVFWCEEERLWRVELRRAYNLHTKALVPDGVRCPVLAFALSEVQA